MAGSAGKSSATPPRELRTVLSEFAGLVLMALIVAVVLPAAFMTGALDTLSRMIFDGGKELYAQAGWALTLYITVLLGFFAVSIGGQILATPVEGNRIRRTLGLTAEVLAALSVPMISYIIWYCIQTPSKLAGLLAIVPAYGLMTFLALQLGRFVVYDVDKRLRVLDEGIEKRNTRLEAIGPRSARPPVLAFTVSTLAPTALATVLSIPFIETPALLLEVAFYLAVACVLLNLAYLFCVRLYLTDLTASARTRWFDFGLAGLMTVLTLLIPVYAFAQESWAAGTIFLVAIAGCLLQVMLPRRAQPLWMLDWSVAGAGATLAVRSLTKARAAAEEERRQLLEQRPDTPTSWRDRITNAVSALRD